MNMPKGTGFKEQTVWKSPARLFLALTLCFFVLALVEPVFRIQADDACEAGIFGATSVDGADSPWLPELFSVDAHGSVPESDISQPLATDAYCMVDPAFQNALVSCSSFSESCQPPLSGIVSGMEDRRQVSDVDLFNVPSTGIARANFADMAIAPFKFRVVGNAYGEMGNFTREHPGQSGLERGFKTGVWGGTVGADRLFGDRLVMGIHGHIGNVDIKPVDGAYDGSVFSLGGIFRMTLFGGQWYWDASFGGARNSNKGSYSANDTGVSVKKKITQMNYQTELGLKMKTGFTKIEPFLGVRHINLDSGGIFMAPNAENSIYSMVTSKRDSPPSSTRTQLGSRFLWEYSTCVATIKPALRGAWVHEFGDKTIATTGDALLFPIAYEYGNRNFARDRAVFGAGISAALRDMVDIYADYAYSYSSEASNYSLLGGFNVKY